MSSKKNTKLNSLPIMSLFFIIFLLYTSSFLPSFLSQNYANASTLSRFSPQNLDQELTDLQTNSTTLKNEFKAGNAISGEYLITFQNDSIPIVEPSPEGLTLSEEETALQSNIEYLENNSIRVKQGYNFSESGVALLIKTPQPSTSLGGPVDIGGETSNEFTVSQAKKIFAPAEPTGVGDSRPLTNADEFCDVAEFSNIETCEVNRMGSVSASIELTSQILPTGMLRIGAYNITTTTPLDFANNNTVAIVMDTGVSPHSDLNLNQTLSKSFIGNDRDNWNHGSHVAGIIGAKDNGFGIRGVAPGVEIISVKVLDPNAPNRPGGTSTFLSGLQYIANLADILNKHIVVNLSITLGARSDALNLAIQNAVDKGVLFVAAAGNSAIDASSVWPGSITPADNAILVSAIGDSDGKCGGIGPILKIQSPSGPVGVSNPDDRFGIAFSNYGSSIDLAAPGINILSTGNDQLYHLDSGTSMAAPHVTGAALLYFIKNPAFGPTDVKNDLINNSVPSTVIPLCTGTDLGYFIGDVDSIPERMVNVQKIFNQ
jgi:subtilisin family serine protease